MSDKKTEQRTKRLPKGQRKHIRRLKQAARKEASLTNPQTAAVSPKRASKKQDTAS